MASAGGVDPEHPDRRRTTLQAKGEVGRELRPRDVRVPTRSGVRVKRHHGVRPSQAGSVAVATPLRVRSSAISYASPWSWRIPITSAPLNYRDETAHEDHGSGADEGDRPGRVRLRARG